VTPLQKRPNAPDLGVRRILAGRLRGNDIVLIHDTVSKFHAWFEWTSAGLYLTDADSKNGTTVDDEALRPKEARAVRPGQCIRFGSIYTTLCDAECLWDAVQR
jgi:pSer/pThr/pTyr-binding forkhead associated (FHA) protein